jgi:MscS family membrane protein
MKLIHKVDHVDINQTDLNNSMQSFISWLHIPKGVSQFFTYNLFGNTLLQWSFALLVFALFLLFRKRLTNLIQNVLNAISRQLRPDITVPLLNILHKPIKLGVMLIGFQLSFSILTFNEKLTDRVIDIFYSFEIFLLVWAFLLMAKFLQNNHQKLLHHEYSQSAKNFINLTMTFAKIAIIVIFGIMLLKAWGYNPSTLIASLGILGMAAALAAQDTTKNIFGAMMIFMDKPFKIGDWIKTSHVEGTIEEIGMRSTKVKTFEDAIVSVPNGLMANEAIINWTKREKRRIKMTLGLTYSTTSEQMTQILSQIRTLLKEDPDVHQQTIFVNFLDFNDSSLGILCYFFTKTVDWGEYMNIRERINLEFMKIVEQNGASFAFPSRSIYIESEK